MTIMQIETEEIPQAIRARVARDLHPGGVNEPATTIVQVRLRTDMIAYTVCDDHTERAIEIFKHETCWTCEAPAKTCSCSAG